MKLLITAAACLALAACGTGDRANKPSDAGEALNALAPAATPDNEAAAAGNVIDETTDYNTVQPYVPEPNDGLRR